MSRTTRTRLLFAALASVGCGGARLEAPDGAAGQDGAPADAVDATEAPADTASGDDAPDVAPRPLPVASVGSRLVVPGAATLVGRGLDSCTNAPTPSGDRWCAFGRPAGDFFELWVIDATKATAGAAIACDGTDASCLRVSKHLYKSHDDGFVDAGFNGDTLVYGENPYAGDATGSFVGVLWAWRPGWTTGRALTSELGVACVGQASSDAAMCFENRLGDGMNADLTIELHAGHLEGPDGAGLPMIDTLILVSTTDAPGAPARCQFDLAPDGQYVAWSTRTKTDAVETLHAYQLGSKSLALVVAKDVSRWAMSPDGAAWYWLAGYNYDVTGAPAGTLQTAAFPDAATPTTLAPSVGELGTVGDKGLWFRAGIGAEVGTLSYLADRGAPATVATVDTKVRGVLAAARDGARFLYTKTFTPVRPGPITTTSAGFDLLDLYVGTVTGDAPCVVVTPPAAVHATLAAAGDLAVWDSYDPTTGEHEGVATTIASCGSTPFATRLANLLPAGDTGFVYRDDADDAATEATLRYARVVDGALPPGVQIQTRAAPVFAPLPPALPAVMYTVATSTAADGLYVYVDPAAATDAGAAP